MKNVILITNSFPFGIVEAGFLAPEYEVLKEKADVYTVTRNTKDKMTTSVPEDRVFRYASHYGKSVFVYFLKALVSPMYYRELAYLKREKKLAFSNAKRALKTLMRALHFETFLKKSEAGRTESACFIHIGMTIRHWRQLLPQKTATGLFREYTEPIYISMRVTDTISPIKTRLQDE